MIGALAGVPLRHGKFYHASSESIGRESRRGGLELNRIKGCDCRCDSGVKGDDRLTLAIVHCPDFDVVGSALIVNRNNVAEAVGDTRQIGSTIGIRRVASSSRRTFQ